jgi:hypothetical protein
MLQPMFYSLTFTIDTHRILLNVENNNLKESVHNSVKGGMKYNTGRLLMVLHKPLIPHKGDDYDDHGRGYEDPDMDGHGMLPMP